MKMLDDFSLRFGKEVRKKRREKGLTQGELANLLKKRGITVTQGYISLLEAGQRCDPSIKLVVALAGFLELSIDELIF